MATRVLTYHRPWNTAFFTDLSALAFPDSPLRLTTDFIGYAGDGLGLALRSTRFGSSIDDGETYDKDVVARCRLLRRISPTRAARLLSAMRVAARRTLDEVEPDVIFGQTVDSYVLDVLRVEASRRGIPYLGIVPSPVDGYVVITARGEHHRFRLVDDLEAADAVDQLTMETYRPHYMPAESWRTSQQFRRAFRTQLRRPVNVVQSIVRRDPLNHHYVGARMIGRDLGRPGSIPRAGHFVESWEADARARKQPIGFLPLQVWPEANSEYWLQFEEFMPYPSGVLRAVRGLRDVATVLVKEHPQFVGVRQPWFRRALRDETHVIMVPPAVASRAVQAACDFSMVWSGSVGIEAAVHGQPVLDFGGTYLTDHGAATPVSSAEELADVGKSLAAGQAGCGLDAQERRDFMRRTLQGYVRGRAHLGRGYEDLGPPQMEMISQLGTTLRDSYPSWRQLAMAVTAEASGQS